MVTLIQQQNIQLLRRLRKKIWPDLTNFIWNEIHENKSLFTPFTNSSFQVPNQPKGSNHGSFSVTISRENRQRSLNEKEILSQVNISGLRAATDENREKGRRIIWIFLLTVCFAVMVAQITDRVRHFLSEPVAVQVTVARNHSLLYPAITICNKVRTYIGKLRKFNFTLF